ncbi:MAG: hypothetical protein AAF236_15495 [Verrucomicrobiota bacterium]
MADYNRYGLRSTDSLLKRLDALNERLDEREILAVNVPGNSATYAETDRRELEREIDQIIEVLKSRRGDPAVPAHIFDIEPEPTCEQMVFSSPQYEARACCDPCDTCESPCGSDCDCEH